MSPGEDEVREVGTRDGKHRERGRHQQPDKVVDAKRVALHRLRGVPEAPATVPVHRGEVLDDRLEARIERVDGDPRPDAQHRHDVALPREPAPQVSRDHGPEVGPALLRELLRHHPDHLQAPPASGGVERDTQSAEVRVGIEELAPDPLGDDHRRIHVVIDGRVGEGAARDGPDTHHREVVAADPSALRRERNAVRSQRLARCEPDVGHLPGALQVPLDDVVVIGRADPAGRALAPDTQVEQLLGVPDRGAREAQRVHDPEHRRHQSQRERQRQDGHRRKAGMAAEASCRGSKWKHRGVVAVATNARTRDSTGTTRTLQRARTRCVF